MAEVRTYRFDSPGALLAGGDWAYAHHDLGALGHVAHHLALRLDARHDVRRDVHLGRELIELARLCQHSELDASWAWPALRARVHDALCAGSH